ncbi:MAG: ABC transporter substrate-binding protein, partial [Candidatus Bathyarchaeota archaeon]|nr:ABC transporter substrate-binding protein [Candidatus Bathyarchaeota archaeon]
IEVPADAWFSWNVDAKDVITAPPETYAKAKIVVNYGDVIGNVRYHDGSVMSLADWFAFWPLRFERANPASSVYDESYAPSFETFRTNFRGQRLVSESPLVMEYYSNYTTLEAEDMVTSGESARALPYLGTTALNGWPDYPWHVVAVGMKAEDDGSLAFSSAKSKAKNIEWMNYLAGTSLPILKAALDDAEVNDYRPLLVSQYASAEEAVDRYGKLADWYNTQGHFWVASGPFYLDLADFTAHIAVAKAFRDYTYAADRWAWLASPPIPESSVELPEIVAGMAGNIVPGVEATFTLNLMTEGQPYQNSRIDFVKYLVIDTAGNVITDGEAVAGAEGEWAITLTESHTADMMEGTYTLLTIALSKDVALPGTLETPFSVSLGAVLSYFNTILDQREAQTNAAISALETTLTDEVSQLQGVVSSLQTSAYAAIAVAIIGILVAIYSIFAKKT